MNEKQIEEFKNVLKAKIIEDTTKRVELLCEDLKQSLSNPNGVMSYDEICNHDDRFLCECRINWICAHIKKAFE